MKWPKFLSQLITDPLLFAIELFVFLLFVIVLGLVLFVVFPAIMHHPTQ